MASLNGSKAALKLSGSFGSSASAEGMAVTAMVTAPPSGPTALTLR